MTPFDHVLALALIVLFPAYAAWDLPRFARRVAADPLNARTKTYVRHMVSQWAWTLALVAAWWLADRPMSDLGLRLPGSGSAWLWSLLISGAGIAFICQQALSVLRSPDAQAEVRKHFESQPSVRMLLPWTPREARVFVAVAVTAGICEEILYRGYLLWYLRQFMPGVVAIATAIVAFGVGHAYQGARGVFATGVAGAVAMTVYLITDSLLAPMLLHAALDLVNGLTIYRVCPRAVGTEADQPS